MRKPYTKEELSSLLRGVFKKNGIKKAIVFGSYAVQNAKVILTSALKPTFVDLPL